MYPRLVRNKKTKEIGKLIYRQNKYFTVLVEWENGKKYHKQDDIEYVEYKGANGVDQVRKIIRARQWEAMVTVKTLKNTNANDDVELQDFALAA